MDIIWSVHSYFVDVKDQKCTLIRISMGVEEFME